MYPKFLVFMIISVLVVTVIYSSTSSSLFALKVRSKTLCEKTTADGITTETCCSLETDSKTEETTEYCTECKTTSKGEDLGCTHTQTDVGFTLNGGMLDIKPIGPPRSIDQLSDDNVKNRINLKDPTLAPTDNQMSTEDSQLTSSEGTSRTPPPCPNEGPIPPNCTMKPPKK